MSILQSKCVEYWPNTEGSDIVRIYGDYHVQLQRRDVTSYWIRSALLLKNMEVRLFPFPFTVAVLFGENREGYISFKCR